MNIYYNRKSIRLKNYDYSKNGIYFVTICTHNRKEILSKIDGVGAGCHPCPKIRIDKTTNANEITIELTEIGKMVKNEIEKTNKIRKYIKIEKYVIMPNHVHFIIKIDNKGRGGTLPLHAIVGRMKSYTNKKYNEMHNTNGLKLWQRNFYEHIIRNEQEYYKICEYINNNPIRYIQKFFTH